VRRWFIKSWVKVSRLTVGLPAILIDLNAVEVAGMGGVAVKCIDTIRNTNCVGKLLSRD
jgi:hypothetical protein